MPEKSGTYKMIKYLKIFLGNPEQLLDHVMIRFPEFDKVEFITTDGHALCIIRHDCFHRVKENHIVAISFVDFESLLHHKDLHMEFFLSPKQITIILENNVLEYTTLNSGCIPNVKKILNFPLCDNCTPVIDIKYMKKIIEFCDKIKESEIKFSFTGDEQPITVTGCSNITWKIIFMPLAT